MGLVVCGITHAQCNWSCGRALLLAQFRRVQTRFYCACVVPQRYDALMKRDPASFSVGTYEVQSAAVSQFRKWRVDTIKYRIHQHRFALLYGSITDLVLPMKMTEKKWWIKRRLCVSTVQHVWFMLAAILPIRWTFMKTHSGVSVDSARRRESGRKEQLLLPAAFKQPLHADSDRAKNTTKALGRFIVKDMQPCAVVEDAGFQHMINVTLLEPRYNIPSRRHLSNTVIPEQTRLGIVKELSNTAYVALTTDGWTSRATESYLTVTGCPPHHFRVGDKKLRFADAPPLWEHTVSISLMHWHKQWQIGNWRGATAQSL